MEEEGGTLGSAIVAARRRSKSLSSAASLWAFRSSYGVSHPSRAGIQLLNKAKSMFSQVLTVGSRFIGKQPRVRCEFDQHRAVKWPRDGSKEAAQSVWK